MTVFSLCCLTACEKAVLDDENPNTPTDVQPGEALISLRIAPTSTTMEAFGAQTRTVRPVQDVCSRITIAFFQNGQKVKTVTQDKTADTDFGSPSIAIAKGSYQLVAIAHNGTGNATLTSPTEVKFPDNKVTDTFYYCDSLRVTDDASVAISLPRAVAMFRFVINDNVPQEVATMKFYYTGGSSTLDATSGYGCVNSRQTELFTVSDAAHTSSSTYEVFTFPHADGKKLQMTVTALNAAGAEVCTGVYKDVEVRRGQITRCQVDFFQVDASTKENLTITVDDTWTETVYEP